MSYWNPSSPPLFCCLLNTMTPSFFFFFNDTPPPEIYPLPLPDALPICFLVPHPAQVIRPKRCYRPPAWILPQRGRRAAPCLCAQSQVQCPCRDTSRCRAGARRFEKCVQIGRAHVELQSLAYLVCRLLLE